MNIKNHAKLMICILAMMLLSPMSQAMQKEDDHYLPAPIKTIISSYLSAAEKNQLASVDREFYKNVPRTKKMFFGQANVPYGNQEVLDELNKNNIPQIHKEIIVDFPRNNINYLDWSFLKKFFQNSQNEKVSFSLSTSYIDYIENFVNSRYAENKYSRSFLPGNSLADYEKMDTEEIFRYVLDEDYRQFVDYNLILTIEGDGKEQFIPKTFNDTAITAAEFPAGCKNDFRFNGNGHLFDLYYIHDDSENNQKKAGMLDTLSFEREIAQAYENNNVKIRLMYAGKIYAYNVHIYKLNIGDDKYLVEAVSLLHNYQEKTTENLKNELAKYKWKKENELAKYKWKKERDCCCSIF